MRNGWIAAVLVAGLVSPAMAQQMRMHEMTPPDPQPDSVAASPGPASSPSSQAFTAANEKMMAGMNRPLSGDADRDFVAGMLPHHQGAVDMAKVELQFGRDPALRRLARGIVAAQEHEMEQMQAWQKAHPTKF